MAKQIRPEPGVCDELGSAAEPWAKIVAVLIEDQNGKKYLTEDFDASNISSGLLNPDRLDQLNSLTEVIGVGTLAAIAAAAAAGAVDPVTRINAGGGAINGSKITDDSIPIAKLLATSKLLQAFLVGNAGEITSDDYNGATTGFKISKTELKLFLATAVFAGIAQGKISIGSLYADKDAGISVVDPAVANSGWHVDKTGRVWCGAATYEDAPFQIDQYGNTYINDTPNSLSMIDAGAINLVIKDVQASQQGGQFSGLLTLTSLTRGAQIYYTIDGSNPSDPTNVNRHLYSVPFNVDTSGGNKTVKAVAYKLGTYGNISTWLFTTSATAVAAPVFSPIPGYYTTPNTTYPVMLSSGTIGATMIYTTDGTTPSDTNGTVYTGAINLPRGVTTTVKAFAKKAGLTPSGVVSGAFNIKRGTGGGGGGGNEGGNS